MTRARPCLSSGALESEVGKTIVRALDFSSSDGDLARIVDRILEGSGAAGADAGHAGLARENDVTAPPAEVALNARAPLGEIESATHVIVCASGRSGEFGRAFEEFRESAYGASDWKSLADVAGQDGVEIKVRPGVELSDFRFPVAKRELSEAHRALVVLDPPAEVPDHDDPFCEEAFFVLEELLSVLGFLPSGRILTTGLYFPSLEENPILKRQAFELGRELVVGRVVVS